MPTADLSREQLAELREIVADVLGTDQCQLDAEVGTGSDTNWDSLAHLSIVTAVEERFGIKFDMDEIQRTRTLAALAEVLSARLAA